MADIPDTESGTSRAAGFVKHPESGVSLSFDGELLTRKDNGEKRVYLALDSMPEELLDANNGFTMFPETVNQRPVVPVNAETYDSGNCILNINPEAYSHEREINSGYHIVAKTEVGPVEYSLAEQPKTHFFVTWERTPGNDREGKPNWYWGHYYDNRRDAVEDFCARVSEKCRELEKNRKPSIRKQLSAKPSPAEQTVRKTRGADAR